MKTCATWLLAASLMGLAPIPRGQDRTESFDQGTRWTGHGHRPDPARVATRLQDFGYDAGRRAIGGWLERSLAPAWYAMKVPTVDLDRPLNASGRFTVPVAEGSSGVLFGWFHHETRGWRTPNSLVVRLDGNGGKFWVLFEYGTRNRFTGSGATFEGVYQTTQTPPTPADGKPHVWTFSYDPSGDGLMRLTLDGQTYEAPLAPGHKRDGAQFDRFGLLNVQTAGKGMVVFLDDLVVDGQAIDLTADPRWEAFGNRVAFRDPAVRPVHDLDWRPTNHAGGEPGEVGGLIWRVEEATPERTAWFADAIGPLTGDRPLRASGRLSMRGAGADSAVLIGWFAEATPAGAPPPNCLAVLVEGPSRVGHYFRPVWGDATGRKRVAEDGPVLRPDGQPHTWTMRYQPPREDQPGQVVVSLDGREVSLEVAPGSRFRFDRFGLLSWNRGGHHVEVYLDDLTYAAGP